MVFGPNKNLQPDLSIGKLDVTMGWAKEPWIQKHAKVQMYRFIEPQGGSPLLQAIQVPTDDGRMAQIEIWGAHRSIDDEARLRKALRVEQQELELVGQRKGQLSWDNFLPLELRNDRVAPLGTTSAEKYYIRKISAHIQVPNPQ